MHFDDLDKKMRVYETASDNHFVPGLHLVVRLDGRGFTGLTRKLQFEKPFDTRFHDMMVETTRRLMVDTGFSFRYGYTQSDEISLWIAPDFMLFDRQERKLLSILAGAASAYFTQQLGQAAIFDARVCQLPNESLVVDYFRWRHEDAHRNSLTGYCYWTLRRKGYSGSSASKKLEGMGAAAKNELLFQEGINFNEVTAWHKRGTGLYTERYEKQAYNKYFKKESIVQRTRIKIDDELPLGDEYAEFIQSVYWLPMILNGKTEEGVAQ